MRTKVASHPQALHILQQFQLLSTPKELNLFKHILKKKEHIINKTIKKQTCLSIVINLEFFHFFPIIYPNYEHPYVCPIPHIVIYPTYEHQWVYPIPHTIIYPIYHTSYPTYEYQFPIPHTVIYPIYHSSYPTYEYQCTIPHTVIYPTYEN